MRIVFLMRVATYLYDSARTGGPSQVESLHEVVAEGSQVCNSICARDVVQASLEHFEKAPEASGGMLWNRNVNQKFIRDIEDGPE